VTEAASPPAAPWRPILKIVHSYLNDEPIPADHRRRLKKLAEVILETHANNWDGFIPEEELTDDLDL
jgi:hypothetical protein